MQLQRIPLWCREVTYLVLWTVRAHREDTKLPNNPSAASEKYHCILSIRKSITERKWQHRVQTTASKKYGQLSKYTAWLLSPLKSPSWCSLHHEDAFGDRRLSLFVSCQAHLHSRPPQSSLSLHHNCPNFVSSSAPSSICLGDLWGEFWLCKASLLLNGGTIQIRNKSLLS